jgi:hypothetical protein
MSIMLEIYSKKILWLYDEMIIREMVMKINLDFMVIKQASNNGY